MSKIFKIRVLSDEVDDFVREYEVPVEIDLLGLHDVMCSDLEYDSDNFCSFFAANEKWEKMQEYTLIDMEEEDDDDDGVVALPMEGTLLGRVLSEGVRKLIFMFDLFAARSLFVDIADMKEGDEAALYPRVAFAAGDPPSQTDAESLMSDEDPFSDMMSDFDDFEGSEDDTYSDDL